MVYNADDKSFASSKSGVGARKSEINQGISLNHGKKHSSSVQNEMGRDHHNRAGCATFKPVVPSQSQPGRLRTFLNRGACDCDGAAVFHCTCGFIGFHNGFECH